MSDLLFDVPWWLPTLLAIIGIALFINGNKSQAMKVRNAGLGLILLAIAWSLLSYFVDTDKEKVDRETRQLVQNVVDADWTKFQSKLTPSATVTTNGRTDVNGADMVVRLARTGAELVHLKSARVQNMTIEQTGPLIAARCDLFTTQDAIASMETSSWQFDWERTSDGWKIREIRLLRLHGVESDQLHDVMPRPR
jgi:hypothetical protein